MDVHLIERLYKSGIVAIPIDEEKARYTFYIACKSEDKKKRRLLQFRPQ